MQNRWLQKGMVCEMYRRNYMFCQYNNGCYPAGKSLEIELPRPGKYKIVVTLKSEIPLNKVTICTDTGNIAFAGSIPTGIFKQTIVINAGNSVRDDSLCICQDRNIAITVMAESDCFHRLSVSEITCPAIYIAGSADDTSEPLRNTAKPFTTCLSENRNINWKQMLTAHTDHSIAISDYSRLGLTIESFRKKGLFAAINEYSRPGDFCFFQFDPLSQAAEDWAPGGFCRRQLARYIIECRERLIYPVLLTPAACHNGEDMDDLTGQLWKQCLDAYREVGQLTATPVIELHKLRVTAHDAYVTAGLVAKEIARVCGAYPERGYQFLSKCMGANG